MKSSTSVLAIIVISQFFCTSLWFAGNGVLSDLIIDFNLHPNALGHLTSAVQIGFITGTFLFALLTIADRYSPSKVFFISALLGAIFNSCMIYEHNTLWSLIIFRFSTGFFLAGIYPVGMKIAADYFDKGLGRSLGFLVGALVIGTALPHLLKSVFMALSWQSIVITISILAILGGSLLLLLIPDGPYRRASLKLDISSPIKYFYNRKFRLAAFGYFGHMWELYAFWAFVPVMLKTYNALHPMANLKVSLLSFLIIGIGGIGCAISGIISQTKKPEIIAFLALFLSCCCCLISPLFFKINSSEVFIGFLIVWGMLVVADSPLFSTVVATNATPETKGSALTIVNCIGFAITVISIQLLTYLSASFSPTLLYTILGIGPLLSLISFYRYKKYSYKIGPQIKTEKIN